MEMSKNKALSCQQVFHSDLAILPLSHQVYDGKSLLGAALCTRFLLIVVEELLELVREAFQVDAKSYWYEYDTKSILNIRIHAAVFGRELSGERFHDETCPLPQGIFLSGLLLHQDGFPTLIVTGVLRSFF